MTVEATLCHIVEDDRILLQLKSANLFGEGKWNGVGGKLEPGESPRKGAAREAFEETGLRVYHLKPHGILKFYFGNRNDLDLIVYVFSTSDFEGMLKASEEGVLRWFHFDEIPYHSMWQDDRHWLPLLLEGKNFEGVFYFNEDGSELLDFSLTVR